LYNYPVNINENIETENTCEMRFINHSIGNKHACPRVFLSLFFVIYFFFFFYSYVHTMFGSFITSSLTYPSPSLSPPTPSLPDRNYFALISKNLSDQVKSLDQVLADLAGPWQSSSLGGLRWAVGASGCLLLWFALPFCWQL
jgi:hypothetical protein